MLLASFHTSSGSSNLTVGNAAAPRRRQRRQSHGHHVRRLPDHCGSATPTDDTPPTHRAAEHRGVDGTAHAAVGRHLSAAAAGRHFGEGNDRRRARDRHALRRCPGARRAAGEPASSTSSPSPSRATARGRGASAKKPRRCCAQRRSRPRARTSTSSQAPATRARVMPNRSKARSTLRADDMTTRATGTRESASDPHLGHCDHGRRSRPVRPEAVDRVCAWFQRVDDHLLDVATPTARSAGSPAAS